MQKPIFIKKNVVEKTINFILKHFTYYQKQLFKYQLSNYI